MLSTPRFEFEEEDPGIKVFGRDRFLSIAVQD